MQNHEPGESIIDEGSCARPVSRPDENQLPTATSRVCSNCDMAAAEQQAEKWRVMAVNLAGTLKGMPLSRRTRAALTDIIEAQSPSLPTRRPAKHTQLS
jgi:hypothetical protein